MWIIKNQLGRRNLTNEGISYFRGRLYNQLKRQGKRNDLTCRQSGEKLSKQLASEYKVGSRTIERDADYANALDEITKTVGQQIRPEILSRKTKLTKTQTKELADLAHVYPEVVKETFSSSKKGKEIIERIKRKIDDKLHQPFPFSIGEVVWLIAKGEASLRAINGFWGVIQRVYDSNNDCAVLTCSGEIRMKADHLKSCDYNESERQQAQQLMERIARFHAVEPEAVVVDVIQGISRRNRPQLTQLEETILKNCEQKYGNSLKNK